jgi:hypothetical protein
MEQRAPAAAERSTTDRVFGAVGAAMLVLAAIFFVRSLLPEGEGTAAAAPIPTLAILSPAPGAVLDQPIEVIFDAGTPLVLGPMGWEAEGRHVHLFVGDAEVMATSAALSQVRGTRYRWSLPRLAAGETTLRLTWSGADHRSIAEGASEVVPVHLR